MKRFDLNADLGEGTGHDEALLEIVSSASIACGGHAGDPETIRRTLRLCKARGVRAGAHPGYADKARFGRFRLILPLRTLLDQIRAQLDLIRRISDEEAVPLRYVKLHGALANQAAEEMALAVAVFGAVSAMDSSLAVLALDNSAQVRAANAVGLKVIREAYADRAYTPEGLLVPRDQPGAMVEDRDAVVERCLRLAEKGEIVAIDGSVLRSEARSICLHGDTPDAVTLARDIRQAFERAGIAVYAGQ